MGLFQLRNGQEHPLDYDKLLEEFKLDRSQKYGFKFIGDMRNPTIEVFNKGKKIKERKPKK